VPLPDGYTSFNAIRHGKSKEKTIGKRDQFAPELLYFSDSILNDHQPEPRLVKAVAASEELRFSPTSRLGMCGV
jgi:hypothetical protein